MIGCSFFLLHMQSSTSTLLTFFLHVPDNIGDLSLYSLTFIGFQKGQGGFVHSTCGFLLIGLAIHIAFDVALLTIGEIAIAGLDIINNSLNSTT